MTEQRMKVLLVAGARPNFMKVTPVLRALIGAGHEPILVHTGQHYDYQMSQTFFDELSIPAPKHFLRVGSGTHAVQTAAVMAAYEPVLLEERPDWVLVPGDVNSTLACALVTAKLKEETGARLAHLEAGLRSRDWRMPEEVNRVLTDHCSDLLLTPSLDAATNLAREGIADRRVGFVGNVMIDTLLGQLDRARRLDAAARLGISRAGHVVVTLHRPSNVDDRDALATILRGLQAVAEHAEVILPLHPRTRVNAEAFGLMDLMDGFTCTGPLPYTEMISLVDSAAVVFTDSGGLQEETTALGIPCVTLREQTERPITITDGTNRLAPWPLTVEGILNSYRTAAAEPRRAPGERCPEGWDGHAAERVVTALREHLDQPIEWYH